MAGYWWVCEKCGTTTDDFKAATGYATLPKFIRGLLIPTAWSQDELLRSCPKCKAKALRLAYEFLCKNKSTFRVHHIVGLADNADEVYVPMMWTTKEAPFDGESIYDFKYINGNSTFGLKRPAILSKSGLAELFRLQCKATGKKTFFE